MSVKFGEPFGLDISSITADQWKLVIDRIVNDMKSDFIFAPHIRLIFVRASEKVLENVKSELASGKYLPSAPITIEVPKSNHMKVTSTPPRPGPNYSRPGSILLPKDRIVYQLLADQAISIIESKTDHSRSFSHKINSSEPEKMFVQTRVLECTSDCT